MLTARQLSSSLVMNDSQNTIRIGKITARTGDSQAVPPEWLSRAARPPLASMRTSLATRSSVSVASMISSSGASASDFRHAGPASTGPYDMNAANEAGMT